MAAKKQMKDFTLTRHSLEDYINNLQDELEKTPVIIITTQDGNTGKWGMARVWRSWMVATAKWMVGNGASMPLVIDKDGNPYGKRLFNKDDAHELFTSSHLGVDAKGVRLSWAKKDHDGMRAATKGERFNAMFKHEIWATERGIILFKPRGSDYEKAEQEQNK
jgi:hypothetical protein